VSDGREDFQLFKLGVQYYVAARSTALAGLLPTCGNLYHHSVEMLLKGALSHTYTLNELKDKFLHDVLKLWEEFTSQFSHVDRRRFNKTLAMLHKFEDRYPDKLLKKGGRLTVGWSPKIGKSSSRHLYHVNIPELDYLLAAIFEACSHDPLVHTCQLSPRAREILIYDNPVASQIFSQVDQS
jgi:hypothetical protein